MIVTDVGYYVSNLDFSNPEWLANLVGLIITTSFLFSTLLIFSHLIFFGCCIKFDDDEMKKVDLVGEENDDMLNDFFQLQLKAMTDFKESVSFGLFLIFTSLTIVSIIFIFSTTVMVSHYNTTTTMCNIGLCFGLLLMLGYIGLASDEADQKRQKLTNIMW